MPEALEVADEAGITLDDWQVDALDVMLGERQDGRWAAFECGLEVPRQNGKGALEEVRELTGLFALEERLIIHSAHEQLTSSEHFLRVLNLIEGVPAFDQKVKKVWKGKGTEGIETKDGCRILFKTRTSGAGRGLSGDLLVLDEAMILPAGMMAALVPTMSARSITGNPQILYAGSSVDRFKHEHGVAFASLRARALDGKPGICFLGWCADVKGWREAHGLEFDPGLPEIDQVTSEMLDDPAVWLQANPGGGIRIALEHMKFERGALGAREFAVERCGIADPPELGDDSARVITADEWAAAAASDEVRISDRMTFSVDGSPSGDRGSISVAGRRPDGLWQGACVESRRGLDWIAHRGSTGVGGAAIDLAENHSGSRWVVDPAGPAAHLIPLLEDAGLDVLKPDSHQVATAGASFVNEVTQGRFRYPSPAPDLSDAVTAGRAVKFGERWRWGRREAASDISPLVAVTHALWGAMQEVPEPVPIGFRVIY